MLTGEDRLSSDGKAKQIVQVARFTSEAIKIWD